MLGHLVVLAIIASIFAQSESKVIGEERIIGGTPALTNEYPFVVSLQYVGKGLSRGQKFCGGSILSNKWVLTAAHCFEGISPKNYPDIHINAGTNYAFEYTGTSQLVRVEKIIPNDKYNPNTDLNDICLLKLSKPLKFTDSVRPIELPLSDHDAEKHGSGVIMGWGAVDPIYHISYGILRKTDQTVMPQDECRAKHWPEIKNTQMCVHDRQQKTGDCTGDSGGPFVQYVNEVAYAVGVTSYGSLKCAEGPTIYTRVTKYLSWINTTMAQ